MVAVVGALLVGGATTGTTHALWRDQANLPASAVTSGSMSHTVLNGGDAQLGTISLAAGSATATPVTATVRDTSAVGSKNLRQDIRLADVDLANATNGLTPHHLLLSVTKKSSAVCPTAAPATVAAGYASAVLDRTAPAGPAYEVCVTIAAVAAAPASAGTLRLTFAGQQVRPDGSLGGWASRTTATVHLTINSGAPAAPVLTCREPAPSAGDPGYRIEWTATGLMYQVHRAATATGPYTIVSTQTSTLYTDPTFGRSEVRFLLVRAVNTSGESVDSNILKVERNGNSDNFRCGPVTP